MHVFGKNQRVGSLQRLEYMQRPRRVGNLALEGNSSTWPKSPGWEGTGYKKMYLEKQAGLGQEGLMWQAKSKGFTLRMMGNTGRTFSWKVT